MQTQTIHTYGFNAQAHALIHSPKSIEELHECVYLLQKKGESATMMGGGNSFGDVFLPANLHIIQLQLPPVIQKTDAEFQVSASAQSGELFAFAIQHQSWLSGCSGSWFNTVGGDVSADVNGKDSGLWGNFCNQITQLQWMDAAGTIHNSNPQSPEWPALCSGLGALGIILQVHIKPAQHSSGWVHQHTLPASSLPQTLACIEHQNQLAKMAYAWTYPFGRQAGKGKVYVAELIPDSNKLPAFRPPQQIAGLSVAQFWKLFSTGRNILYTSGLHYLFLKSVQTTFAQLGGNKSGKLPYWKFQYPMLSALPHWNVLFQKHGMHEFQCWFPKNNFEDGYFALVQVFEKFRVPPELCAIRMHTEGVGWLSLAGDGFSCTFNYDRRFMPKDLEFQFHRAVLDIVIRLGGKIHLAKFPYVLLDEAKAMFPQFDALLALKQTYDPNRFWQSAFWNRMLKHD